MIPILAAAGTEAAQQGFLETFGVNWPFFIAQLINFVVVLFVLKKFAFGPIQGILEVRRERIVAGEAKLEEIAKKLAESEQATTVILEKANTDAKRMITEAKDSAGSLSEKKAQEAVSQAQSIIAKAKEAAQAERVQMSAELKQEFGRLVVATTSQVSGKILTQDDQNRINQEALSSVQN
ncbi:F0F1 ATP synthase subunit B [bacterium]|jgi:F-type H+-transporting ATPase subunit b|nr:F0F1 ATP synthase subunit B [bacterium]